MNYEQALESLSNILKTVQTGPQSALSLTGKDEVLRQYQPMFTPEGIRTMTAEDFRGFLKYKNNRHWKGLRRRCHEIDCVRLTLWTIRLNRRSALTTVGPRTKMRSGLPEAVAHRCTIQCGTIQSYRFSCAIIQLAQKAACREAMSYLGHSAGDEN